MEKVTILRPANNLIPSLHSFADEIESGEYPTTHVLIISLNRTEKHDGINLTQFGPELSVMEMKGILVSMLQAMME